MPLFKPSTLPSFHCTAPNAGPRRPRFARRTRPSADAGRQGVPPPRVRLRARSHTGKPGRLRFEQEEPGACCTYTHVTWTLRVHEPGFGRSCRPTPIRRARHSH
jgi:hypothetical protein